MTKQLERYTVKSMTGFARVNGECRDVGLEIEIKSVNHRFFEFSFKGPRAYAAIERDLKAILQGSHKRGKFDVSIYRRAQDAASHDLKDVASYDLAVSRYAAACQRFGAGSAGLGNFISALVLRDLQSNTETVEIQDDEREIVFALMKKASVLLLDSRESEGAALVIDISRRIVAIESMRGALGARVSGVGDRFRARLHERLAGLSDEIKIDPERLALEVAILADKVDVTEELTRLSIHLSQFQNLLNLGSLDGVGRKLDFTLQEIGREINTIGSKVQDAEAQSIVVEAKAELEKVREQIQNVE